MDLENIFKNLIQSNNILTNTINHLILYGNDNNNFPISNKLFNFCLKNVDDPSLLKEIEYNLNNILSQNDIQPKSIRKVKNLSIHKFTREQLKNYTDNFTQPCVFTFDEKFDMLKNLRQDILNSDVKTIYCKETATFSKSNNFDSKKHNIFNHDIYKKDLCNIIPSLNEYLLIGSGFISKKTDFTNLHNEIEQTINIQIEGKKKWVLIDPKYSDDLMPVKSTNIINYYSIYSYNKNMYDKFHKKVSRYEVELQENDCLFIPSWWFHAIDTMEDSLSLSLRYLVDTAHNELYFPKNIFNTFIDNLNFNELIQHQIEYKSNFVVESILEKLIGVDYNIEETKKQFYYYKLKEVVETILNNK